MTDSSKHLACDEVVELVTDHLDSLLPPHDATLVEQHLSLCKNCVWYVEQIRTTIETVGRIEPEEVPPDVRDGLLVAFRDWRRLRSAPETTGAAAGSVRTADCRSEALRAGCRSSAQDRPALSRR